MDPIRIPFVALGAVTAVGGAWIGIRQRRRARKRALASSGTADPPCDRRPPHRPAAEEPDMIRVASPTIEPNQRIPDRHVRDGDDRSPALRFESVPDGTAELALICDDPDAPRDEPFVHWVVYGLPPDLGELDEATSSGTPGTNDWGERAYGGPQPPPGHGTHHDHFRVYALDAPLDLAPGATKAQLIDAMRGRVLDEGQLVGTYER